MSKKVSKRSIFILLILLQLTYSSLYATLAFENYVIEKKILYNEDYFDFIFKFKNNLNSKVKIINVQSTCGCTIAKSNKLIYNPSEEGMISGTFHVGDKVGLQEKQIIISTNDLSNSTIILTLKVNIPQFIEIKPRIVIWEKDVAVSVKEIQIETNNAEVQTVESLSEGFKCTLIMDNKNKLKSKIEIAPLSTKERIRGIIKIKIQKDDNTQKEYFVHAIIK